MQLLLPFTDLPPWPRVGPKRKNWFPRIKAPAEQFGIFDHQGPLTFAAVEPFYPLFWSVAIGDTEHDREESFCKVRAHVLRKLSHYRRKPGSGFEAWMEVVCRNWKISEIRKQRPAVVAIPEDFDGQDSGHASVETASVFERVGPQFAVIVQCHLGLIGKRERNEKLREMGVPHTEFEALEEELAAWLRKSLGPDVPRDVMASAILLKSPLKCYSSEQYSSFPCQERALLQAAAAVGITEHPIGSNLGPEVEYFQRRAGGSKGDPWCAEMVMANCLDAAIAQSLLPSHPQSGIGWLEWGIATGRMHQDYPHRADVFVIRFDAKHSHVGWVVKADANDFWSIEGNSNNTGSREGYEVCRHARHDDAKTYFITLKGLCG